MNQKLFGFVLLGALSASLMLHAVPGDNQPPEATPLAQAQQLTDTTPPIVFSHVATAPEEESQPSTSLMEHAVPGNPGTTLLAQAQQPTDNTPPIVFSHVATASAGQEEELHPSRLEQIRDNLSEELGAGFQALTEEQQGLMIDIMQKVHDVVPILNIRLMKASARWQPTEAAEHEARCLEEARQAIEQHLTPTLGSEEAAAESRRIQECRATENEKLSELASDLITNIPQAMRDLFGVFINYPDYLTIDQWSSSTYPYQTYYAHISQSFGENSPPEEAQDSIDTLLGMMDGSYIRWSTDQIRCVNLYDEFFREALRKGAVQKAMKERLEYLSRELAANSHVVPETVFKMLSDKACQDALLQALPKIQGVAARQLLDDHGVLVDEVTDKYVTFHQASSHEKTFRDIYECLVTLIRTRQANEPKETVKRDDIMRYLFGL